MPVNKAIILGRLGQDPELKTLSDGTAICKLSIATTEVWKDKNGDKKEETQWHNLTAWRKNAEIINQYVKKGDELYVEGKIKYTKSDDGSKYYTDITVDRFSFISGSKQAGIVIPSET